MHEIRRALSLSYRQGSAGKMSLPWKATAPTYRRLAQKETRYSVKLSQRGAAHTYIARPVRQLAGPMTAIETMGAYTMPILRIPSMATSADPHGDPPNARCAYLPGESALPS